MVNLREMPPGKCPQSFRGSFLLFGSGGTKSPIFQVGIWHHLPTLSFIHFIFVNMSPLETAHLPIRATLAGVQVKYRKIKTIYKYCPNAFHRERTVVQKPSKISKKATNEGFPRIQVCVDSGVIAGRGMPSKVLAPWPEPMGLNGEEKIQAQSGKTRRLGFFREVPSSSLNGVSLGV